eukprot:4608720-Pleurochrysis_carterae.AAC.3
MAQCLCMVLTDSCSLANEPTHTLRRTYTAIESLCARLRHRVPNVCRGVECVTRVPAALRSPAILSVNRRWQHTQARGSPPRGAGTSSSSLSRESVPTPASPPLIACA